MSIKGILSGAAAIKDAIEKGPKGVSRFLKLADGESVTIRFLQELDESGKNFDADRGLAVGFYEHMKPETYESFRCTMEQEGRCAGCERAPADKRLRARGRLLINVLVRNKDGADEAKVFGTSLSSKGLAPTLVEYADDYGSLCDRDYKLTRRGEGINTTYTLVPREVTPFGKDEKSVDLIDLGEIVRDLSYEEQDALLSGTASSDW